MKILKIIVSNLTHESLDYADLIPPDTRPPVNIHIKEHNPTLAYSEYRIIEVHRCEFTADGKPYLMKSPAPPKMTILISESWYDDKKDLKPASEGGYIGSGYYKFGVKVRIC
jgi:hypothetical protein